MVSSGKMISIVLFAALAIASCQAKCPEGDSSLLIPAVVTESLPDDSVDLIPKSAQRVEPTEESSKLEIVTTKKETCECAASQAEDTPKAEQMVIKKVGKKYKVITITLPIEVDNVEAVSDLTTETTPAEVTAADEEVSKLIEPVEPIVDEEVVAVNEDAEPERQEKAKKEKVKVEKKKYKRDVGNKSADKKSSKRKNKEQGKKKSKK